MKANEDIFFLTGDLGYGVWDQVMKDYPHRAINIGAAEQAMLDIACGLSIEGKIPFCYSITTFLLYRGFETLRTYINHENLNVNLIGSGRDKDYTHDGFSHDATDVPKILDTLENVHQHYPNSSEEAQECLKEVLECKSPDFINLRR